MLRRELIGGGLALLATTLIGDRVSALDLVLDNIKDNNHFMENNEGSATFVELSKRYALGNLPLDTKKDKITVLYPGSSSDITPLEFGLQVLHRTPVKEVDFIEVPRILRGLESQ